MASPYQNLPKRAYWATGVARGSVDNIYTRKFAIDRSTRVVTAGSCFAQHIARNLRARGFNVVDTEPPPPGLEGKAAQAYGYQLYSARYGNIYTSRHLLQLILEVRGRRRPSNNVWAKGDRYFDALRPSVEPEGLGSPEEVLIHRQRHLAHVKTALRRADVFVFTLGLTETWAHKTSGTVYPTAPETIAGQMSDEFEFKNLTYAEVKNDLLRIRHFLQKRNPNLKMLLTVSPVPLTATASTQHVLPATIYSKSILRAAAGDLAAQFDDVDYFPSYELIGTPFFGDFYEANKRSVADRGVELAMRTFLAAHGVTETEATAADVSPRPVRKRLSADDLVCEEALLEAFS